VQYQVRTIGSKTFVEADRQVLSGNNPKVWGKQLETYINEEIRRNTDVPLPTTDGHVLLLTARSSYKLTDPHKASIANKIRGMLSTEEYRRKLNVAAHIDELIQVARFGGHKEDVDRYHKNDIGEDGFNYYEAFFADAGGYYKVPFSAGINGEQETVYSIGKIEKGTMTRVTAPPLMMQSGAQRRSSKFLLITLYTPAAMKVKLKLPSK